MSSNSPGKLGWAKQNSTIIRDLELNPHLSAVVAYVQVWNSLLSARLDMQYVPIHEDLPDFLVE
jgi:hypothetical protein